MNLIVCKDLSFSYNGTIVLDKINFNVEENDYLCIVGENGSGKSTLIKGLLGLKSPKLGNIDKSNLKDNEIGYLPQQNQLQKDFPASVYEVVLSGCLNKSYNKLFYNRQDKIIANENIEKLGIENIKNKSFSELSGGQRQRALLARALCATKKILLLDEPVAGLDPIVTKELYELIQKINQDLGVTIIMVSHDIAGILKYASKILHIKNEQLYFGKKEEYLKSNQGNIFFGGMDYV